MPAVMAAVISIIFCAINPSPYVNDEAEQGWLTQLYCLLCTLGCAIVGGLGEFRTAITDKLSALKITGFIYYQIKNTDLFLFQLPVVSSESH